MNRNIPAIAAIFLFTTAAWVILGSSIMVRTQTADKDLSARVASTWGQPQQQSVPAAFTSRTVQKQVRETYDQRATTRIVEETINTPLPLEQSRVHVVLNLEQRQKGLLWFPTYRVDFRGAYVFRNTTADNDVVIKVPLPVQDAIYDDLIVRADGQRIDINMTGGSIVTKLQRPPGSLTRLEVGYKSQGMQRWTYSFGENVSQVRDFDLEMETDFSAIDFPGDTISPTSKRPTRSGWLLAWRYNNLLTGYKIGMLLPEKLQPGPLAERISFFAPVSLLFFFFLMVVITALKAIELRPVHYFFLATSFFAFHLLLAYLVDHISIHAAFAICSAVSIFLVVSYLRIVVGPRFAFVEAASAQFIYLVLFSYAFFFKGFTGLAITIGAIVTLFVVMQVTARRERAVTQAVQPA
jgi:inner membrane protein involved in colicin E2 resistance